jgi:hypothetical protein
VVGPSRTRSHSYDGRGCLLLKLTGGENRSGTLPGYALRQNAWVPSPIPTTPGPADMDVLLRSARLRMDFVHGRFGTGTSLATRRASTRNTRRAAAVSSSGTRKRSGPGPDLVFAFGARKPCAGRPVRRGLERRRGGLRGSSTTRSPSASFSGTSKHVRASRTRHSPYGPAGFGLAWPLAGDWDGSWEPTPWAFLQRGQRYVLPAERETQRARRIVVFLLLRRAAGMTPLRG